MGEYVIFSKQAKLEKIKLAKQYFRQAYRENSNFRSEGKKDFAYHDGTGQWTDEEKSLLASERRPCFTFNLIKSSVELLKGMNEENKIRPFAAPVEKSDGMLADILNEVAENIYDEDVDSIEDKGDDVFESGVVSGRGYLNVDYRLDPRIPGFIKIETQVVPCLEITPESSGRLLFWEKWITADEFVLQYPEKSSRIEGILETGHVSPIDIEATSDESSILDSDNETEDDYDRELDTDFYDRGKKLIRVIHMEYLEPFKRHFGFNPEKGEVEEFEPENLSALKEIFKEKYGTEFDYYTISDEKVKWFQFTGDDVLFDGDSPMPYDGYSLVGYYVYGDKSGKTMNDYGIVRLIRDSQDEVNRRWSQTANMINQQVQPGVFAETEAFVNQKQAEESMKEAGSITWLNPGGLNKIKERTVPIFPDAPMKMEEIAQQMIRKITGINPDLLGLDRGRQEPGVVVRMRQIQGSIVLRSVFRNFHKFQREVFEKIVKIIIEAMPDEQILHILGSNNKYTIQDGMLLDNETGANVALRDLRHFKHNIKIEESPGNLTKRALEVSIFLEMMSKGFPVDPTVVIEKLELSDAQKTRWIQFVQAQQEAQQAAMEAEQGLETQKHQDDVALRKADTEIKVAKVKHQQDKDMAKMLLSTQQLKQAGGEKLLKYDVDMSKILNQKKESKVEA